MVFWRSNLFYERKRGDLLGEVKKYLASRNFTKKTIIVKVQESLTVAQAKDNNNENLAVFGQAEAITVALHDSLLSYMSVS